MSIRTTPLKLPSNHNGGCLEIPGSHSRKRYDVVALGKLVPLTSSCYEYVLEQCCASKLYKHRWLYHVTAVTCDDAQDANNIVRRLRETLENHSISIDSIIENSDGAYRLTNEVCPPIVDRSVLDMPFLLPRLREKLIRAFGWE